MVEIPVIALLSFVGVVIYGVLSSREPNAAALWTWACIAIVASGACNLLIGESGWILPFSFALGTAYPAMLLAGALAFTERRVPRWLAPGWLAVGASQGLLVMFDRPQLAQALGFLAEPTVTLWAAVLVLRSQALGAGTFAQRALAPALALMGVLDAATTAWAAPDATVPAGFLTVWGFGVPLLLAIQITAVGDRLKASLRSVQEILEQRVRERTAEIARSVSDLKEQVAERRAAEQALRESEERYRIVSELSSDYSFMFDLTPDGSLRLHWITAAVKRITGFTAEELQGRDWQQLFHPGDIDVVWINGYGFPAYRGGPMGYADLCGLDTVQATLQRFEKQHGEVWKPAPLLSRLVSEGKSFSDM